ncbi:prepilin-type N-terminal cleavage/methylation domain-containing protein [Marinimicrobium alkaliphilum]|uniref:prepilin-type N-terminal cleavage/methylation domain-containing protein n=1 Tax=Marinimicrobium alkaliphilum TaxID=2202654 RepID=UPI0013004E68|nr:prepilin-type N-terminal cleavage/methylation domain-containing protein [Marinimicrobium alkaliphilum]
MNKFSAGGHQQRGFTLIELLVVLFIVGMAIGMVSFAVGRDDGESLIRDESEHFLRQARFVAEQSVLNSEVIGFFIVPQAVAGQPHERWCYDWRRYRDGVWEDSSSHLSQRCLSERLEVEMIVEGEPYRHDRERTSPKPVLVFYPSGESTPFEIALSERGSFDTDGVQRLQVDMVSDVRWLNREEELEHGERRRR